MAGNVNEWTSGTIAANQQPGFSSEVSYAWKEWNNALLLMNGLLYNSQPASIGISGITGWSSTQGIGELSSDYGETVLRGFLRSGKWANYSTVGVLALTLNCAPGNGFVDAGFRVSK
jgi:hypothetical protein